MLHGGVLNTLPCRFFKNRGERMRVLLGMSGGLDSTYAAAELKRRGYEVEGAILLMHGYTETKEAALAAKSVGIPLHIIDCREAFEECVVSNFISEYQKGRTPNPCIICNREVKFKYLYEFAMANGFDKIATGHYANIVKREIKGRERYAVSCAFDTKKDQTYMLYRLSQEVLSRLIFPLSDMKKNVVRENAGNAGIYAAEKDESQEICFIPDNDHAAFIKERGYPEKCGYYINNEGKILGEHSGIIKYTVGQRKGLGISLGKRVFVTEIDAENNTVTLSENPSMEDKLTVTDIVFSGQEEMEVGEELILKVKLRYLAPKTECRVKYIGDGRAEVLLDSPQKSITPGQSAVFYDGDTIVFGGFISTKRG